jgi:predicted HTH domain antitoxin
LEIPDEVSHAMRLPPAETKSRLQLELAISLYAQDILSLGKAAELAGISRLELNDVLAKRGVPMHYTQEDLSNDLAYARGSQ